MIWEVRARLFFDTHDEANDFYHDCQLAFFKSTIVNPASDNEEASTIHLLENNHDQDPNQPCVLLQSEHNAT